MVLLSNHCFNTFTYNERQDTLLLLCASRGVFIYLFILVSQDLLLAITQPFSHESWNVVFSAVFMETTLQPSFRMNVRKQRSSLSLVSPVMSHLVSSSAAVLFMVIIWMSHFVINDKERTQLEHKRQAKMPSHSITLGGCKGFQRI